MALLAAAMLTLVGCKPKAGESCTKEGERACADPSTQLVCQGGKRVAFACKGASGCQSLDDRVSCDISGAAAGDPCSESDKGRSVCAGDKQQVRCDGAKISVRGCPGSSGCRAKSDEATTCDLGEPEVGASCVAGVGSPVCSLDRKALFECRDGKWARAWACLGRNACRSTELGLACDASTSEPGSPCTPSAQGKGACSVDGKTVLSCDGAQWKVSDSCAEGKTCRFGQANVDCTDRGGCLLTAAGASCQ